MAKAFSFGQMEAVTMVNGSTMRCTVVGPSFWFLACFMAGPTGSGTMEASKTGSTTATGFSTGQMVPSTRASGSKVDHTATEATRAKPVGSTLENGVTERSTAPELAFIRTVSCTQGNSRTTFVTELGPANGQTAAATLDFGTTTKCATPQT